MALRLLMKLRFAILLDVRGLCSSEASAPPHPPFTRNIAPGTHVLSATLYKKVPNLWVAPTLPSKRCHLYLIYFAGIYSFQCNETESAAIFLVWHLSMLPLRSQLGYPLWRKDWKRIMITVRTNRDTFSATDKGSSHGMKPLCAAGCWKHYCWKHEKHSQ